ncbi:MAG TPA: ATP-binding protein [Thermoanaerobaculia bacterium]
MKDPYYQKILVGLDRLDNPAAFEECACDLLRKVYPSLVWIRGGSDAGMDGAIADGDAEAYPLVVTTERDFTRNLKRSLASYTRSGKTRRRAVFATSRSVTPTKQRELERIARTEYGFTLVYVHHRYDFAARLYRDSRWVRDLLGITGEPPALSAVPRTCRPLPDIELVGRDADLQWLHETEGHRLVVGQPGSGKTALLLQLVREGKALFLASDDETRIAEACRDSQPDLILVDDAHLDPEKLTRLRQIRAGIGASFDIVASAWPHAEIEVANALEGIGSGSIRKLEGLTRAEIVQVLRGIGLAEPDDDPYLVLLVDQSANKPGLAVTLGSLWLRGEGHDILTGKALQRSLIPALKQVLEHDPTRILACFALGGDRGMSLEAVGEFLEVGREEIHRRASLASQGGLLSVHRDQLLSVQPETLRSTLLAEVFFTPPALPYRPLLDRAPDREDAIDTLAMAALREVNVPRDELRELVLEAGSVQAWQWFALLGEKEGQWVLERFPAEIEKVTPSLLRSAPGPTIRRLLHEAEGAEGRPIHWGSPQPLRLLRDWIWDVPDPPGQVDEALRRRRMLVKEAKRYLRQSGDRTVGLRACFLALSPRLESSRLTATRDALTLRQGSLPASSVPRMLDLWAEVREELGELTPEPWSELEETLRGWVRPDFGREPTEEETDRYRAVATRMVSDLVDRAQGRPALFLALKRWADRIELTLPFPQDGDYLVLFPPDRLTSKDWGEVRDKRSQAARELAARWASRLPQEVSQQLASYAAEAGSFGSQDSWASGEFFHALAGAVDAPEEWLGAFLENRLPPNWLRPLLERVVRQRHVGWEQTLKLCLESEEYSWLAGDIAIRSEGIPQNLIDAALARLPADSVETACLQRRVPLGTLRALLEHEREEIAVAAAAGEWLSEPRGEVRPQISSEWRSAVLRLGSGGGVELRPPGQKFGFEAILGSDPNLAALWLLARIEDVIGPEPVERDGVYAAAIQPLTSDRREGLLRQLPANGFSAQIIPLLVGESRQLYHCLLAQDRLRRYHLAPLAGRPPDAAWAELAELAREAGHEPRAIAEVTFEGTGAVRGAVRGFGIERWSEWEAAFRRLLETAPEDLQEVARYGIEIAEARISEAEQWKRRFELTGKL